MDADKRYNGWTNYETWVVKLWMDNEQGTQEYWAEQAQATWNNAQANGFSTKSEAARYTLAGMLKDEHDENTPTTAGVYADLLNAALSEVDWYEIADSLLGDVTSEQPDDAPDNAREVYESRD